MIMSTVLAHLFPRPRMRLHPWIGAPLGMEQSIAQHTLLTTRHSEPIVLKALDESPIFLIPVCRVLTAQSQLSQSLTLGHPWVIPMVGSDPAPGSLDVVFLGNAEDDGSEEEETISLPGFSKSDTKEVCGCCT